jgi:peptidoglycan hydrolase CwlO-like protein
MVHIYKIFKKLGMQFKTLFFCNINKQIDIKIDSVKENVISITKEIHHIDNTITIIKKQTDEKINNIDKFSNAELEFFFTNRYNKSYSAN